MQKYFKCGTIRPDRSDKTVKYEVRSIRNLVENIIPHFEDFPLLSAKQKEFKIFAQICRRMIRNEHLTVEGFRQISKLAERLNVGSKKKYLRSEFKV
jgi:hypothetical protein